MIIKLHDFRCVGCCDVMNTQNQEQITRCTSLQPSLFKTEGRYFLKSSYKKLFYVHLYDNEMKYY